jgi:hypothetical protein
MMPGTIELQLCYLCSKALSEPIDDDHVPAQGFFAPEIRRRYNLDKLITIPVHEACNALYKLDEEYFLHSLYPLALGTEAGEARRQRVRERFHAGENRKLVAMVMAEFDHRPGGLVLPFGQIIKRFYSNRIERVLWKIVRGLNFHHHGQVWPENCQIRWSLTTREDPEPPEHFKLFMELPDNEPHGEYQAVFSYRFKHIVDAEIEASFHYWALLIWDSILVTLQFPDQGALGGNDVAP